MNSETMTFRDISAADVYARSDARIRYTLKRIGEELKLGRRQLPRFESDARLVWAWGDLPIGSDWFFAWGIRFSESDWWKDAQPPLPNSTTAFVVIGPHDDKKLELPGELSQKLRGNGWSSAGRDLVIARPLNFSSAEDMAAMLTEWIFQRLNETK